MVASRIEQESSVTDASWSRDSALRWWMVLVIVLLTVLSFIDRNALNVLIDDIKRDFGTSDTHAGLLLGASFALLYGVAGLPAGYLVDRFSRRAMIFGAVIFWSAMTAFSGLASSFGMMFVGRMGVGLGEAVLSPAGSSLIRSTFPLHLRARAFGLIMISSSVGGGFALLFVGALVHLVPDGGLSVPVLGQLQVWQIVLLMIGLGGIPFAFLVWTFPEPVRTKEAVPGQSATIAFYVQWIGQHRKFYGSLFLAQALTGIGTHAFSAWLPIALARSSGVPASQIGMSYGSVQIAAALTGLTIGTTLLDRLLKRSEPSVALVVSCCCILIAAVSCVFAPLMPTLQLSWAMLALHWLVVPSSGVGAFTALTAATPNVTMGKVTATSYLSLSVAGYGLGPSLAAGAAKLWPEGPMQISYGISSVTGTALVLAAVFYWLASRHLARVDAAPKAA